MDRESRRNSILKPSFGQTLFDGDEENNCTENFTHTFTRRKSLKRVSFAGRDQIKEFEKHEVLVNKAQLTEVFNKLKDVSADNNILADHEKENMMDLTEIKTTVYQQTTSETLKIQTEDDDMEITTTISGFKPIHVLMQQTVSQEIEMEVTTLMPSTEEPTSEENKTSVNCQPTAATESNTDAMEFGDSIHVVEMSIVQDEVTQEFSPIGYPPMEDGKCGEAETSPIEKPMTVDIPKISTLPESDIASCEIVANSSSNDGTYPKKPLTERKNEDLPEPVLTTVAETPVTLSTDKMDAFVPAAVHTNPPAVSNETQKHKTEDQPPIRDFIESWTPEFGWQVRRKDGELLLTKLCNCLTLRLELNYEYLQQNVRHYVVEDIEVETKRGLKNKWARFGLSVLENTLENCNLKSKCSTTQELDKLLNHTEEYISIFQEFILHDSESFEWMTNPRSLRVDIDNLIVSFELSNLENLLLIRITMKLNPIFPLCAVEVNIENILGTINNSELINMISTISPNGKYLSRVAECVEDYLKFLPIKNECGVLDSTRC